MPPEAYTGPSNQTQPTDASAANKALVTVSVETEGTEPSCRRYYLDPGSETWKTSSIRTAAYSITMTAAKNGRRVYCVVTDKFGARVASETATLTMTN